MRRTFNAAGAVLCIFAALGSAAVAAETPRGPQPVTVSLSGVVLGCPEEEVALSGAAKLLQQQVITPSGVIASILVVGLNGVTAYGQSSGTSYRVVGATATGFRSATTAGGATTSRFVQTWLLVPIGDGAPLSFLEVLNVTYNANGDLVSVVFNGPAECD